MLQIRSLIMINPDLSLVPLVDVLCPPPSLPGHPGLPGETFQVVWNCQAHTFPLRSQDCHQSPETMASSPLCCDPAHPMLP